MIDITDKIALAQSEGCTHQDNLPFILGDGRAQAAVLLVHGFTGSPWEMKPLAAYLAGRGFFTYAVRLPGHGTSPEDLAGRIMEEWLAEVSNGLARLAKTGLSLFAAGQSTGALLTLMAALNHNPQGLVLLSPFLRIRHRLAPAAGLLQYFKTYQPKPLTPQETPFYYDRRPVAGVHQINRLTRRLRVVLPQVRCPALVVSAQGDQTVITPSALDLFERLGSPHKQYHLFGPEAPHVLTTVNNPRQGDTLTLTASFFAGLHKNFPPSVF